MPRAYADVVGNFRRGEAGAYARGGDYRRAASALAVDDPQMSEAYRQRGQEEEQTAYRRDYGSDYASGNYEAAATRAGKQGDLQGVAAARDAGTQASEQQRVALWRGAQQNITELEAIEQNQGQGYEDYLGRAQQALQQNPQMDPEMRSFIQSLPPHWNPRVTGAARNFVTRLRDNLLTPEQSARLDREQSGVGERRYTGASGGILDTYTGQVNPNPYYVRGGAAQDGPPAPPDGYRIVGGQ